MYDTGGEAFYDDITKIDYRGMPDFDLLVGGCVTAQDIFGVSDGIIFQKTRLLSLTA